MNRLRDSFFRAFHNIIPDIHTKIRPNSMCSILNNMCGNSLNRSNQQQNIKLSNINVAKNIGIDFVFLSISIENNVIKINDNITHTNWIISSRKSDHLYVGISLSTCCIKLSDTVLRVD